eukprot:TRINITY_DN62859_c0_g1_i1.p1 TRINITY_DN62859_c0_g1~~TRINITY_DN62859_c0_g1_i1.p1  ORF type:complete len:739 (-),score=86.08 TRINITY_DN62859_c0_g1_i1:156-2372(-)
MKGSGRTSRILLIGLVVLSFLLIIINGSLSTSRTPPADATTAATKPSAIAEEHMQEILHKLQEMTQTITKLSEENDQKNNLIKELKQKVQDDEDKFDKYKTDQQIVVPGLEKQVQKLEEQLKNGVAISPPPGRIPPPYYPPNPPPPVWPPNQGPSQALPEKDPDELEDPVKENERRRKAVKEAFLHGWNAYKKYAWGRDEFQPLSKRGKDWTKNGGGFGLTILDSISSLWLLDLKEEFAEALEWIKKELTFNKDADISAFESTIRMVAGLLSAYELSGEEHKFLLDKAVDLTDRLLFAYNTTTGIPHATVNLFKHTHTSPKWTGGSSVLSEFGTVQMEFRTLSFHTGNDIYDRKGTHIMKLLEKRLPPDGLAPTYLNPLTGKWTSDHITLGALGDSYYEYLLKQYVLTGKQEPKYKEMWEHAARSIISRLVKYSKPSGQCYLAEHKKGMTVHKMDHLACFAGGMFGMAAQEIGGAQAAQWQKLGEDITETCHLMYSKSRTWLSPEIAEFKGGGDLQPGAPYYILRPETMESYFYMWRYTKQQKWRDYGWQAMRALLHWCKIEGGGFSGLKNVNIIPPVKDDLQQSFFLAETLKYLYLLFADDDVLDLQQWVLNTEAHPFKIRKRTPKEYPDLPTNPGVAEGYEVDLVNRRLAPTDGRREGRKPAPPGYQLLRSRDAPDVDLGDRAATRDPAELAKLCNEQLACQGFNSNGYLKKDVSKTVREPAADLYVKDKYAAVTQ